MAAENSERGKPEEPESMSSNENTKMSMIPPMVVSDASNLNVAEVKLQGIAEDNDLGEQGQEETENVSYFGREFKLLRNYITEEVPDLEEQVKTHVPYIVGAMVAAPAFSIYSSLRHDGIIGFVHKTSLRSKIAKMLIMSAGLAAYQLGKPTTQDAFLKDIRHA